MPTTHLTAREINDMLVGTFDDYGEPVFTNIAQELQQYEFMPHLLKDDRTMLDNGIGIKRTLMTKLTDVAQWIGLHPTFELNFGDHLAQLDVAWKHLVTNWVFEAKELMMNSGDAVIAQVIKPRETNAMLGLASQTEDAVWDFPSTSDEETMFGIPYYVVWDEGNGGGFNGNLPSGHSTVAGIDPNVHTNYRNFTQDYTNFTPSDWLEKARDLHMKTHFISPVDVEQFRGSTGQRFRIYTSDVGMKGMWLMADQRNENLLWDFGHMDSNVTFRGNAFRWVPHLDIANAATSAGLPTDPFYFIDRDAFLLASLEEDHLQRTEAMNSQTRPFSFVIYITLTVQLLFLNRRACGVMGKVS